MPFPPWPPRSAGPRPRRPFSHLASARQHRAPCSGCARSLEPSGLRPGPARARPAPLWRPSRGGGNAPPHGGPVRPGPCTMRKRLPLSVPAVAQGSGEPFRRASAPSAPRRVRTPVEEARSAPHRFASPALGDIAGRWQARTCASPLGTLILPAPVPLAGLRWRCGMLDAARAAPPPGPHDEPQKDRPQPPWSQTVPRGEGGRAGAARTPRASTAVQAAPGIPTRFASVGRGRRTRSVSRRTRPACPARPGPPAGVEGQAVTRASPTHAQPQGHPVGRRSAPRRRRRRCRPARGLQPGGPSAGRGTDLARAAARYRGRRGPRRGGFPWMGASARHRRRQGAALDARAATFDRPAARTSPGRGCGTHAGERAGRGGPDARQPGLTGAPTRTARPPPRGTTWRRPAELGGRREARPGGPSPPGRLTPRLSAPERGRCQRPARDAPPGSRCGGPWLGRAR